MARTTVPQATRLEIAKRHVREGREIVGRQKRLVERQKLAGLDSSEAESLLRTLEHSLATFEYDLADILAETGCLPVIGAARSDRMH